MTTPPPWAVVVVVPARDEAALVSACLRSVRESVRAAVAGRRADASAIVLVAHRCADETARLAQRALAGARCRVVVDETSRTVGAVRSKGVRAAVDLLRADGAVDPGRTWILSTDADSVVPPPWIGDVLEHAERGAEAVVGMTILDDYRAMRPTARRAYSQIIAAGMHRRSHDHVYGANLAIRLDVYDRVGGFPSVPIGEDRVLVDTLANLGAVIVCPVDLVVTTSGRHHGRAAGGLADLLARLDDAAPATTRRGARRISTARPAPAAGTS